MLCISSTLINGRGGGGAGHTSKSTWLISGMVLLKPVYFKYSTHTFISHDVCTSWDSIVPRLPLMRADAFTEEVS